MNSKFLVSIILPTYNGEPFIQGAIKSVLDQTFKYFELIIINDGSSDKTEEIIEKYKKEDNRIKAISQENIGLVKTLNKGIRISQGKYIARIDDDDLWHIPQKLEMQIQFLEKHPDYVVVGTGVTVIDNLERELFSYYKPQTDEVIRKTMLFKCPFVHPSVVFRREVIERVGWYNEDRHFVEDWELWMRLGGAGKLYNIPEYLIKYRLSQENVEVKNRFSQLREGIAIIKIYKEAYPNYRKALLYNFIKFIFFNIPFVQRLFRKTHSFKT